MILNLTQHLATDEQKEAGIIDMPDTLRDRVIPLLNFDELPTKEDLLSRSKDIIVALYEHFGLDYESDTDSRFKEVSGLEGFMIGGAPFFMPVLQKHLFCLGIGDVYYAFSKRVVKEEPQEDGSVIKKSIFKFEGLIEGVD